MKHQLVHIIDSTLREGNQAPGVKFSVTGSVDIAKRLVRHPIGMIEAGHPFVSSLEMERVKAVAGLIDIEVLAHARARIEDVKAAKDSGAQWVGIFAGINGISRKYRIRRTKHQIHALVASSIAYAKSKGLRVRYTVEDASRTSMKELIDIYTVAISEGADRICFTDTVGILDPFGTSQIIKKLVREFKGVDLETHFHDDRGLAMANTLAAIRSGANWVSTSVNGMGERAGITDTCALIANMVYAKLLPEAALSDLLSLSRHVQETTGCLIDAWRPVTGKNAFVHKAKLHVNAMNLNKKSYEWLDKTLFTKPIIYTQSAQQQ